MKSIKKLKKYGTAAAGTALLVGATLTGAAAQTSGSSGTTLGDYPAPFVDDDGTIQSSIVVGEDAATADVVGAIDIAGSLSQAAFTEEEIEGGTATTVNGATQDVNIRSSTGSALSIDASDYDTLLRKTVTDADDTDHFVTESAKLGAGTATAEVNASDVVTSVDNNALHYNVNFAPGFEEGETIEMLGNEYEITGFDTSDSNEVTLGSTVTQDQLELDETYEHGPYTVKVEDFNTNDNSVLVQVSKDGSQLKMQGLKTGEHFTVDNEQLNITADSIYFGSQGNYISISSTYSDTTITEGEAAPMDEDYDVTSVNLANTGGDNPTTLQGLTLKSTVQTTSSDPANTDDENDIRRLQAGESISGPADYFSLTYQGLSDESTGQLKFQDGPKATFNDVEGFSHTLDLESNMLADNFDAGTEFYDNSGTTSGYQNLGTYYVDIKGHPVKVDVSQASSTGGAESDAVKVKVSYQTFSQSAVYDYSEDSPGDVISQTSTGYGFDVRVEAFEGESDGSDSDSDELALSVDDGTASATQTTGGGTPGAGDNTDNEFHTQLGTEFTYDSASGDSGTSERFAVTEGGDNYVNANTDNSATKTEDFATVGSVTAEVEYGIDSNTRSGDGTATTIDEVDYVTGSNTAYDAAAATTTHAVTSENTQGRTTFGSTVNVAGDKTPVTLTVPENQLNAQLALGEVTSDTSEGGTSMAPTYGETFPSVGHLDTDENIGQVKENDNVILVGGPAINDLTAELAQENQTRSANEWQTGGHEGESILQLTEGFDGEGGNKALVVAGHSAEDTRTASEFLSNYGDHSDALEGQDQVTISTETGNVVQ